MIDFITIIAYTVLCVNAFFWVFAMSYIIDGHNLIGVLPDIQLDQPDDELRLLQRLRAFRARHGSRMLIVFFDSGPAGLAVAPDGGQQKGLSSPGLEVHFARPGQNADDAIIAFLAQSRAPGQYAVVTNDQELARRARAIGASVLSASEFAGRLTAPALRARESGQADLPPLPDPRAPAFADLYAQFIAAEKAAALQEPQAVATSVWIERLYTGDPQLAQRAARWLGQTGSDEALEPLRDALTHADAGVRAAAALALGQLGRPVAVPDLCRRLLEDGNSMVREAAAQALGQLGRRSAVLALEEAVKRDAKSKVRKAATAALAQIRARHK
ncbi:MAG: NYN domain-containing protein [Anaerolineae bacterium]